MCLSICELVSPPKPLYSFLKFDMGDFYYRKTVWQFPIFSHVDLYEPGFLKVINTLSHVAHKPFSRHYEDDTEHFNKRLRENSDFPSHWPVIKADLLKAGVQRRLFCS